MTYAIRIRLRFPDDFKPASVDTSRMATVDVGSNNQVTVTVPNLGEFIQKIQIQILYTKHNQHHNIWDFENTYYWLFRDIDISFSGF